MQITRSGYYAWKRRETGERQKQNETLRSRSRSLVERSKGTYGSPRILPDLKEEGVTCSFTLA
jgi:putative transposase